MVSVMALQPTRFEYRLMLSNVDRRVERDGPVIMARHPSETQVHLVLRLLAWCMFNEEALTFGPGLSTPEAADLWAHDATGRLAVWIECGTATVERLRKVQQHNSNVAVHVLMDDPRRATELLAELSGTKLPRAATPPAIWVVDPGLVVSDGGRRPLVHRRGWKALRRPSHPRRVAELRLGVRAGEGLGELLELGGDVAERVTGSVVHLA